MSNSSSDVVKLCPICKSDVRYFFVNFSEKVLLCENENCNYPLGCEELECITVNTGIKLDIDESSLAGHKTSESSSLASDLEDIAKLNKVLELTKDDLDKPTTSKKMKMSDDHIANKEIKKNVQDLKHLTMELNETDKIKDEGNFIKNEKWLKKLIKLEGSSGVKSVPKEMKREQKTPAFDGGELKSDIDSTDGDRTTFEDAT